ncbi:hypothetical protein J2Z69_000888 [Paenibacillus shirakamiensis]|uniref:DUF4367 domain-containing protein n=1 Tax=Paenibacillus shirakamiensis TaxID=1265935 RepID=A0ABS4JDR5_9BACL|nr:hypothetical protein [Paenibacillus shirakamiensis]MBP1999869.1 hypothetical protein [Paenibacillus shirakamiensis]
MGKIGDIWNHLLKASQRTKKMDSRSRELGLYIQLEDLEEDESFDPVDHLIHEAFHLHPSYPPFALPSKEMKKLAWLRVKAEIHHSQKKHRRKSRYRIAGMITAALALGLILLSRNVTQFLFPFAQDTLNKDSKTVQPAKEEDKNNLFNSGHCKTASGFQYSRKYPRSKFLIKKSSEFNPKKLTKIHSRVVDAQSVPLLIDYAIPTLPRIPARYQLDRVELFNFDPQTSVDWVEYSYKAAQDQRLVIRFRDVNSYSSTTPVGDIKSLKIRLMDYTPAYLRTDHSFTEINYRVRHILISIYGHVTREEILLMANDTRLN